MAQPNGNMTAGCVIIRCEVTTWTIYANEADHANCYWPRVPGLCACYVKYRFCMIGNLQPECLE